MTTATGRVGRSDTGTPARQPDAQGTIERDGVRVHWESYGHGDPAILLLPAWSIVHSRHWKFQIDYLSRHFQVVTFDGRGNGLSDRPLDPSAYPDVELIQDAVDVLDLLGIESVIAAGVSCGGRHALDLAGRHPERVRAVFAIAPSIPYLTDGPPLAQRVLVRGPARYRRGLGQDEPPLLASRLAGVHRVLLLADVRRGALDQAARGHGGLGLRHHP